MSDQRPPYHFVVPCSQCGNEERTGAGYLTCECPSPSDSVKASTTAQLMVLTEARAVEIADSISAHVGEFGADLSRAFIVSQLRAIIRNEYESASTTALADLVRTSCKGCHAGDVVKASASTTAESEKGIDRRHVTEKDLQDIINECGHRGDAFRIEFLNMRGLRFGLYPSELLEIVQVFLDAEHTRMLLRGTVEGWKARTVAKLAAETPVPAGQTEEPVKALPIRDAAEFALRAAADTLLTVLVELPDRYADKNTIDRRIAIAAAQKMKGDALRAVDSAIMNVWLVPPSSPAPEDK